MKVKVQNKSDTNGKGKTTPLPHRGGTENVDLNHHLRLDEQHSEPNLLQKFMAIPLHLLLFEKKNNQRPPLT